MKEEWVYAVYQIINNNNIWFLEKKRKLGRHMWSSDLYESIRIFKRENAAIKAKTLYGGTGVLAISTKMIKV